MYHNEEQNEVILQHGGIVEQKQSLAAENKQEQEDALIAAVFEQIRLPEVRFVNSPDQQIPATDTSRGSPNSHVPPNSARTEVEDGDEFNGEADAERKHSDAVTAAPRRSLAQRQQTPRDALNGDEWHHQPDEEEEEEEEDVSLHLLAHRDSLDSAKAEAEWAADHTSPLASTDEQTPRDTLCTSETGECVLDSVRSYAATAGSDLMKQTPSGGIEGEEGGHDADTRASSELSREMVHSAMESALNNCENGHAGIELEDDGEDMQEEEAQTLREKSAFQLELDKKVGKRLSQLSSASTLSSAGSGSLAGGAREVHVRTPLNDPASPLKPLSYTAFEPEKQELIRREIGSTGPSAIRRMVAQFQLGKVEPRGQQEDGEQESAERDSNNHSPVIRQQSQQAAMASDRTIEIVEEPQRPVAEILTQFQQGDFQHPRPEGKPKVAANGRPNSLATSPKQHFGIGSPSVWSTTANKNAPQSGSVAAIRKSLSPSAPGTPATSPAPAPDAAVAQGHNKSNGGGRTTPKNVSEFFRLWGTAQAHQPGAFVKPPSPMGNSVFNPAAMNGASH